MKIFFSSQWIQIGQFRVQEEDRKELVYTNMVLVDEWIANANTTESYKWRMDTLTDGDDRL